MNKVKIELPAQAAHIIDVLESSGFEAYAVGGCVRDCFLGEKPHDWDICTNALPEEVKALFGKVIETGIKHGTVTVIYDGEPFEITTFRSDGTYSDNRHPDSVTFTGDLKEDLSRRDFTCNALAYSPAAGLVDFFDGAGDMKRKIIRCVGEPDKRFREDALRIMRALRFASRLGYEIEQTTSESIRENRLLLKNIAPERISVELGKLLTGRGAAGIMREYADVLCTVIPEIEDMICFGQNNPGHNLDVWEHTIACVANAPENLTLRLAMLLHDIGEPRCCPQSDDGTGHFCDHWSTGSDMAKEILSRLRFDSRTVNEVSGLVLHHNADIRPERKNIKRWLTRLGEQRLRQLIEVIKADISSRDVPGFEDETAELDSAMLIIDEIIAQQQCFSLKDLAVNGNDLISAGITDGKTIGSVLGRLLDMVISEQVENDRETLLRHAKKETAGVLEASL